LASERRVRLRLTCREPFTSGEWWAQRGRIVNGSLAEYHIRVNLEVPDIEVIYTNIPDGHAPLGERGVGVIGITGAAAAVANAVFHATGKRIRDLPITLDKLF
jgi:xanthine dehydrogenase YagR molybdenum-binding subunit